MALNESQRKIAETTEGMMVADAGPGTGKTFTVVSRCINILRKKDIGPKDLIMLTFTRNAAAEMKERVTAEVTRMLSEKEVTAEEFRHVSKLVKETYIGTFDSFCLAVVKQSPFNISKFFGFKEELSRSADITENDSMNRAHFSRFLDRFMHTRGEDFGDLAALAAENPSQMYNLLNRLMARGILPYKKSSTGRYPWFGGNDGKDLVGDTETLRQMLEGFKGFDKSDDFGDVSSLEGFDVYAKPPGQEMKDAAAFEDRSALIDMIHEIYYAYLRQCVIDGHLTFGVVATFAFVVLYSDPQARESFKTRYLIVDEFQDTNTNQMMISLMLLKEPNLCVVGDWKQGIYGFRFVTIENITRFEDRIRDLRKFLNDDTVRVSVHPEDIMRFPLMENYRSSQLVIDRAYESLTIPATTSEPLDKDAVRKDITYITSSRDEIGDNTGFQCVQCESQDAEIEEVLRRILDYVESGNYTVVKDKENRRPRYGDIAVLCRTSAVCRKIFDACQEHGIPAFLQGDVSVMATRYGKMLLAWLRYISNDKDMWGIVPILADLGYSESEIERLRSYKNDTADEPILVELREFKTRLRAKRRRITELISDIFSYYGWDNDITQAITTILSSSHRNSLMTISDLIRIIESDIETDAKYDVDGLPLSNAVIIQTLHKSKGLEYPFVIIPRIDQNSYPSTGGDKSVFRFSDLTGIRCSRTIIYFGNEKKIGSSWRTSAVSKSIVKDYSEERRLLFVGISRAKQYVTLIAGKKPSAFFSYYADKYGKTEGGTEPVPVLTLTEELLVERPVIGAIKPRRKNIPVHGMMHLDKSGYRAETESDEFNKKGMQYGTDVHKLAEMLVRGKPFDAHLFKDYPQLNMARDVVERLKGEGAVLTAERECSLPLNDLNATVRGIIDMYAEFPDRIEVHDWKTDAEPVYVNEYKLQLTVYAHVLAHMMNKPVTCHIDWLTQGRSEEFQPLPMDLIIERAKEFLSAVTKTQYIPDEEELL